MLRAAKKPCTCCVFRGSKSLLEIGNRQSQIPHSTNFLGEDELHAQNRPVFALAEKSVRIGWTYADAFKNVRKRLRFPNRDYLFATKDYQSALEYMRVVKEFGHILNFTRAIALELSIGRRSNVAARITRSSGSTSKATRCCSSLAKPALRERPSANT